MQAVELILFECRENRKRRSTPHAASQHYAQQDEESGTHSNDKITEAVFQHHVIQYAALCIFRCPPCSCIRCSGFCPFFLTSFFGSTFLCTDLKEETLLLNSFVNGVHYFATPLAMYARLNAALTFLEAQRQHTAQLLMVHLLTFLFCCFFFSI